MNFFTSGENQKTSTGVADAVTSKNVFSSSNVSNGISMQGLALKSDAFRFSNPTWSQLAGPLVTSPIITVQENCDTKRKTRVPWNQMADNLLCDLVKGVRSTKPNWTTIAEQINETFGTRRTGKQCRERWFNHLRPDIKKGAWTSDEEMMIRYYHREYGPKWSTIAKLMKNRTDNDIKNKWNSMNRSEKLIRRSSAVTVARKKPKVPSIEVGESLNHSIKSNSGAKMAVEKQTRLPLQSHNLDSMGPCPSSMAAWTASSTVSSVMTSGPGIAPSVTYGDSMDQSPVVGDKNYWENKLPSFAI